QHLRQSPDVDLRRLRDRMATICGHEKLPHALTSCRSSNAKGTGTLRSSLTRIAVTCLRLMVPSTGLQHAGLNRSVLSIVFDLSVAYHWVRSKALRSNGRGRPPTSSQSTQPTTPLASSMPNWNPVAFGGMGEPV